MSVSVLSWEWRRIPNIRAETYQIFRTALAFSLSFSYLVSLDLEEGLEAESARITAGRQTNEQSSFYLGSQQKNVRLRGELTVVVWKPWEVCYLLISRPLTPTLSRRRGSKVTASSN